ncbi:MAG: hypothetical protein JL50_02030 [Peptococcaceae bacterium BICA1-7]|nr:MAG: hypothetical protein JL50_02030 [Peptococcaceae bacterium BICA1-7]HBV96271.1 hypothetical protein [Desulfotomaculum sp.]
MELYILIAALLGWLAYTLYCAALLLGKGGGPAGGKVCVYMGNQDDVAEWFIWSIYRSDGVLAGRLDLAVAVECSGDDTGRIVRILSGEKEFSFYEGGDLSMVCPLVLDVRGMDKKALQVPLKYIMSC